jgi:hypothetical protein
VISFISFTFGGKLKIMKYCTSCGSPIPEGQGNSCSMCYGDVAHGTDGYYEDWLLERMADEENKQREESAQSNNQQL